MNAAPRMRLPGARPAPPKTGARTTPAQAARLPAPSRATRLPAPLRVAATAEGRTSVSAAVDALLDAVAGAGGRGLEVSEEQQAAIDAAVEVLEADGGVVDPTSAPILSGRWQLLYTSRPSTSSPIQRTFTRVDGFTIYQEVNVLEGAANPTVVNVVDFAGLGVLRVNARAYTAYLPRGDFVPRAKPGFPLLGKSATYPPVSPGVRVDFQFTDAAFSFKALPFTIPYPVPFALLDDEVKGWIDTTYMSKDGRLRISRGNKGTMFVLAKDPSPKDQLMAAIKVGKGVEDALEDLLADQTLRPEPRPARSPLLAGTWRQVWSSQADGANWLQSALSGQAKNFQIIEKGGRLTNVVDTGVFKLEAGAACKGDGDARVGVAIDSVNVRFLGRDFDVNVDRIRTSTSEGKGYVDQLYLDKDLRVSRGNKGSMFIHVREPEP